MKSILRYLLVNTTALWITSETIRGISYSGGLKTLVFGGFIFALINILLVPLLKILFLPLNLLTLGLFSWLINVMAFYVLTNLVPQFRITSYQFPGLVNQGFIIPPVDLSIFWVAVIGSLMIGFITHFLHWLMH